MPPAKLPSPMPSMNTATMSVTAYRSRPVTESEQSLPDHLIEQRDETGSKEEGEEDGVKAPRRIQTVAGTHRYGRL